MFSLMVHLFHGAPATVAHDSVQREKYTGEPWWSRGRSVGSLLLAGLLAAQPVLAHLPDPSTAPSVEESVYLYSLTLTTHLDDAFLFFDGDTEIFVQIDIVHNGHTEKWICEFEDIDMDGDLETNYKVLDGTLTAAERKGGKRLVFHHMECEPTPAVITTIQIWEIDSEWISDVMKEVGEALGKASVPSDYALGTTLTGIGLTAAAKIIKVLGNSRTDIGSESFEVPDGVSAERAPTTNYKYQMSYTKTELDPDDCVQEERTVLGQKISDPTTPDTLLHQYQLDWFGWDEEHPFTKNYDRASNRQQHLRQALLNVDLGGMEPGADTTGLAADKDTMRTGIAEAGRSPLVVELQEAIAGGLDPALIAGARSQLNQGDALVASGLFSQALMAYATGFQMLVVLNHPSFFASVDPPMARGSGPRFLGVGPSPTAGAVALAVELPRADRLKIEVLDAQGRVVATIAQGKFQTGVHRFEWDGLTVSGTPAPGGVYFVKLDGATGRDIAKVTVVR